MVQSPNCISIKNHGSIYYTTGSDASKTIDTQIKKCLTVLTAFAKTSTNTVLVSIPHSTQLQPKEDTQTKKYSTVVPAFTITSTITVLSIPQFNQLIPKKSTRTVVPSLKLEEFIAETSEFTVCTS